MHASQPKKIDINAFINDGIALLKKNLEHYPSFDPSKPYGEKNKYFIELARRGEEELFFYGFQTKLFTKPQDNLKCWRLFEAVVDRFSREI